MRHAGQVQRVEPVAPRRVQPLEPRWRCVARHLLDAAIEPEQGRAGVVCGGLQPAQAAERALANGTGVAHVAPRLVGRDPARQVVSLGWVQQAHIELHTKVAEHRHAGAQGQAVGAAGGV